MDTEQVPNSDKINLSPLERFKHTTSQDQTPVLAINKQNQITYANGSALLFFEENAESIQGQSVLSWVMASDREKVSQQLKNYRTPSETNLTDDRRHYFLEIGNHVVRAQFTAVPVGDLLGLIFVDTGEIETLRAAVNYMPCGISVIDKDLQVIAWNEEVLRLQNYSRHLFDNRFPSYEEVVRDICRRGDYGDVDEEAKVTQMLKLAKTFEPHHFVRERSDGTILEIRGAPMPGGGFVTTYTDITEKYNQDQKIKGLVLELEQANKAKSNFLAAASHDLRQPLQAITLFSSALNLMLERKEGVDLTKVRQVSENIEGSVRSLEGLLNGILDVSKFEAGVVVPKLENFRIDTILELLASQNSPTASEKDLALTYVKSSAFVRSDKTLLTRILTNLITNAIRYTKKGRILVGCRQQKNSLVVQVWDTGIGIPMENSQDIFMDFLQLNNPARQGGKGMGLGLAIVKRSAELLGHPIEVKSVVGKGSVFSIQIPLAKGTDSQTVQKKTPPEDLPFANQPTILILDDDKAVLSATGLLLKQWGCRPLKADTLKAALKLCEEPGDEVDLVLSDYGLAGDYNGMEAIEQICQATGKQIPGIIITGEIRPEILNLISGSDTPLLHKPLTPTELHQAMKRLLG